MNNTNDLSWATQVAQFRFALIAPVVQGLFPDASKAAYFKRVTAKPLTLPDGSTFQYSYKTLDRWLSSYNAGGIDAPMPQSRSDKGFSRAHSDTAIEEIYRLKEAFPRLNATQIYNHLLQESFIPASVSVAAVQRFIRKNNLKAARNSNLKDRKAFEEDAFGKMWQADICYLPYITCLTSAFQLSVFLSFIGRSAIYSVSLLTVAKQSCFMRFKNKFTICTKKRNNLYFSLSMKHNTLTLASLTISKC